MLPTLWYIEPMSNETIAVGRDAALQCVVKHLQDYKVSPLQIIISRRSTKGLCITCLIKVFSFKNSMIKWKLYDLLLLLISNKIQNYGRWDSGFNKIMLLFWNLTLWTCYKWRHITQSIFPFSGSVHTHRPSDDSDHSQSRDHSHPSLFNHPWQTFYVTT